MRLLAVGDVCGNAGCEKLRSSLPSLKRAKNIDMVIVNGENAADGNGLLPQNAELIFSSGADVITGGNHSLRRREDHNLLEENEFILRPNNLPTDIGKGYCVVDFGYVKVAVINLSGTMYLEKLGASSAFDEADKLIEKAVADDAKIIVIDFHAEATSEKRALGFYLDGRVSAIFGTHTHVQTADEQVLKNGTGYITDLGMTGPIDSVLGVKSEIIIDEYKGVNKSRYQISDNEGSLCGCIFEIDNKSGKTLSVERICI